MTSPLIEQINVKIAATGEGGKIPVYSSEQAAGMDLFANEDVTFKTGETKAIALGFSTELPPSHHARIESRSGMALKNMIVLTGVIDSDYRGEWKAILHFAGPSAANGNAETFTVARGDRIAQAVLRATAQAVFSVADLSETQRGAGGFGSTGK